MEYEIIHLPIEKWKGTIIPIRYYNKRFPQLKKLRFPGQWD